jgi:hypothetical protein
MYHTITIVKKTCPQTKPCARLYELHLKMYLLKMERLTLLRHVTQTTDNTNAIIALHLSISTFRKAQIETFGCTYIGVGVNQPQGSPGAWGGSQSRPTLSLCFSGRISQYRMLASCRLVDTRFSEDSKIPAGYSNAPLQYFLDVCKE